MLYKQICFVGIAVYATLSRNTFGSTYYAYANSNPTACSTSTSNDHCIFLCDKQDWKHDFHCGNAGICDITCDAKQCLKDYTVDATSTSQLNVIGPSVQNCYSGTTFHLPRSGSANFSTTASSSDSYQQMIVNAGSNTHNIHIDCSGGDGKDECKGMTINAQTADYLYINADNSGLNGAPLSINCPQNSASTSSCYINAWNQATLDGVEINTEYGIPHDLWINVDDTKNFKAVTLTCSGIDPAVIVDEKDLMDPTRNGCWNTRSPTLSPTAPTTAYPTSLPTTYYVYANSGDTACSDAAYNDRCVLICNKQDWKTDFDCGNAGICDITCENKQCLKDSTVIATNSRQLNVIGADVDKCYSGSTFYLPSSGSANFSSSASVRNPYQLMTVNAGLDTHNIYIDCSGGDGKDECQGMIVNAQTADLLYINADGSELDGAPMVINCPQNSNYNGVYEAPCYINAWNKATLDGVEINTEYGIPHDLWVNVDDAKNFKDVTLTCAAIDSNAIVDQNDLLDSMNVCWNTRTPTISPSVDPTMYPSVSPSISPTISPTIHPSVSPTISPSVSPTLQTLNPTSIPTLTPTISTNYPTIQPSKYPTKEPSISPSISTDYPSISPSKYPSITPSKYPSISPSIPPSISTYPSKYPTKQPSKEPIEHPSTSPAYNQSQTVNPSSQPVIHTTRPFYTEKPTKTPTETPNYPTTKPIEYIVIAVNPTQSPSSNIDTTQEISNGNRSQDNVTLSGSRVSLIISIIFMIAGSLCCIIACCMYYRKGNRKQRFSEAVIRTIRTLSRHRLQSGVMHQNPMHQNNDSYHDALDIIPGVNTLELRSLPDVDEGEQNDMDENEGDDDKIIDDMMIETKDIDDMVSVANTTPGTSDDNEDCDDIMPVIIYNTLGGPDDTIQHPE